MKTLDDDLRTVPTTELLMVWHIIMSNKMFREYRKATPQQRADFFMRLGAEIDARIPARDGQ